MELSIDQKIQAATQPLVKRIASLQEEFKMMKALMEQTMSSNKSQITPKNNQPQRVTAQKSKNVPDKRGSKTQEEPNKLETVNKNMKGVKTLIETKEAKTEQSKKPKSELKKTVNKQNKDVGKKVGLDSAVEQTLKNNSETQFHIKTNNDSVIHEIKEITKEQAHVSKIEQPLKQQGVIQNGESIHQQQILKELSLIQDKNMSVEEENLMDKVNQEIEMMNKEIQVKSGPLVQSEHQDNSILVETPFISEAQKLHSVDPALNNENNEYKQVINSTMMPDPTVESKINQIESIVINPNNAQIKQTTEVIQKKEDAIICKVEKKPIDKNSIIVKKQVSKPSKQIDHKVDKAKNAVQPKFKAQTKVIPPSVIKTVKQPVIKQKSMLKSAVNSAKKSQPKEVQMKSQQKNNPNVTAMNQQTSQPLEKHQNSTNMQTMQTLEM